MAFRVGHALLLVAALLLLHAGYSAEHYEALLLDRYGSFDGARLPLDIYVELAAAVVLGLVGSLSAAGSLHPLYSSGSSSTNAFHKLFAPRWDFVPMPAAVAASASSAAAEGQQRQRSPSRGGEQAR